MFILIALVYFTGLTICLYLFAKGDTNPDDNSRMFGLSLFWPVWVPLVVVLYLPFKICQAAIELGKQHRKGVKK